LGLARDPRVIGVALRQIALRNGTSCRVIGSADAVLTEGFHSFEPGDSLRWTDDDAALPVRCFTASTGRWNCCCTSAARHGIHCWGK
jgi:hypothetical protein